MRLSPVWVALAAIAGFRQVMLEQLPATYAAPVIISSETEKTLVGQGDKEELETRGTRGSWRQEGVGESFTSYQLPITNYQSKIRISRLEPGNKRLDGNKPKSKIPSPASTSSTRSTLIAALKSQRKFVPPQSAAVALVPHRTAQALVSQATESPTDQEAPNRIQNPTPGTPSPNTNTPPQTQPLQTIPQRGRQTPPSVPQTSPTVPVIPPAGTQSLPQQDTPNRIQIPITPNGRPTPGTVPNQPNPPIAPATPAPEGTEPGTPTPAPEGTEPGTPTPAPEGTEPPGETPEAAEPRVLVAEVAVSSETGELSEELQNEVYQAIETQAGRTTTRSQLREDINAIFATGFFSNVRAIPEDTPLGVRVSYIVQPNPVLKNIQIQANPGTKVPSVVPAKVVQDIFRPQYGTILNLRRLQEGIKQLNQWYQKNGYVLAQVIEAPQVAPDGTVTLQVAEGVVEDIQVRFVREGQPTDDEGKPIRGRTRDFIITRELDLEPGEVFNRNVVQQDLQRVYGLGLFEDVNVSLNPGQDPRQVVVRLNVDERRTGTLGLSGGISSDSGLFGAVSFQQQNLGGNNQKLGAEVQIGERQRLFDLRFTDPWIAGDPYRTSYTVNAFRRQSISLIFDGDDEDIEVGELDDPVRPRVLRQGGAVNFTRPLSRDPLRRAEWTASAGLQYQRISIRDDDGDVQPVGRIDGRAIDLSFSGDGSDDLLTLQLGLARDRRNNLLTPTNGSFLRFGVEQSIPVGDGNILLNRVRGSYSQYIPVNLTNFAQGPETLAFNVQAGTVLGDLPPYEAFSLGGSNSVRGYGEGELGSGRSFVSATAEYRFPVLAIVGGAVFLDAGTDLGTGDNVPGNPAELLDKPGSGFSYGVGVRVNSPLGPLRLDYAISDEGDGRIQFGIGEKF